MDLNLDQLLADLTLDEGFRSYVYDDVTGGRILAGKVVSGKATLGVGWCPQTNPCTDELGQIILGYHVNQMMASLVLAAPWTQFLPEPGLRAMANMAYSLGVTGLLSFKTFVGLMQRGDYAEAAADLKTTQWFQQVGQRAVRIQALIESCASVSA